MVLYETVPAAALLPNGKVFIEGVYSQLYDPTTGTWSLTSPPAVAHANGTATLLNNGKVLVAGGTNLEPPLVLALFSEVFDPATGTWSQTGNMVVPRYGQTTTLLPNGKVLMAGGSDASRNALANAELYDPSTNQWTPTATMTAPRAGHSATLLPTGKVLVVGGGSNVGSTILGSAETYDPASGTWSSTGSLTTPRAGHTATLLTNGNALVVGGNNSQTSNLNSSETYNPTTGTWSSTGGLATGRAGHTATLLPNGLVLIAGGYSTGNVVQASTELYSPTTGQWSPAGNMNTARVGQSATLLASGRVLAAGGLTSASGNPPADLFDPTNPVWAATSSMSVPRNGHMVTLLPNGKVLVAGGTADTNATPLSSAEIYDDTHGTWTATGSMMTARYGPVGLLLPNGRVLAVGGYGVSSSVLGSAEIYDPSSGTWSATGSLNVTRLGPTTTLLPTGKVLAVGGETINGSPFSTAELYDPASGRWSLTGALNTARALHSATLLPSGKVLVAGGVGSSGSLSSAELYDPTSGTWSPTGPMTTSRESPTATLLPNGKVLVNGGFNLTTTNLYLDSAELYDPVSGTWSATGSHVGLLTGTTAVLLPNGAVLACGFSCEVYDPASGTWSTTATQVTSVWGSPLTLLPNGKILSTGGAVAGEQLPLSTAELYDLGLGFSNTLQPTLTSVTSPVTATSSVIATGTQFQGVSEASGGNSEQNSPTNYPLVQLHSLVNDATAFVGASSWSSTSVTSLPVVGIPPGYALATVYVNAIPSRSRIIAVQQAPTTLTIASAVPNSLVVGQGTLVSFVLTPAGSGPTIPTGVVTISDGAGASCEVAPSAGSCTLIPVATGQYTVTATYSGDLDFTGSTSAGVALTVNKAATQASLSGPTAGVFGQTFPLTATISVSAPGSGVPTGTVTFLDGTTTLGTAAVNAAGQATLTVPPLAVGTHTVAASYGGDPNFIASATTGQSLVVTKAQTATTITSVVPTVGLVGQPIVIGVTVSVVTPGSGVPTGSVTISDGTGASCSASIATPSCSLVPTSPGQKTLTATYPGDSDFAGSSGTTTIQVGQPTTTWRIFLPDVQAR
jgi:N-acetylneuraminic acid mutarotase